AQNGTLDACTDDAATVAAPKVPVTLPVSIPAPGVSAQDCVHVDPMQAAADVTTSLATTASGGTIAAAEATSHANPGVIDSIVGWFLGLFS
ncbi:MAG: hypothetical protein QOI63_1412, partial [Thermoplasmata archaeon]|nr:hypothetical protein [Thermoplasmata archaeon]